MAQSKGGGWIRDHALGLTALGLFLVIFVGQVVVGRVEYNDDQREHGGAEVSLPGYLATGHFFEATFENWESEFLQMGMFIALTAILVQKGSAESRKPQDERGEEEEPADERPEEHRGDPEAPWPVRRGGAALAIYRRSLSIALFALFLLSFGGHAVSGAKAYSEDQREHGGSPMGTLAYLTTARFWFESLQNWQSEFLAVWTLTMLSIWLRQEGSPESKPVHAPHEQTGE